MGRWAGALNATLMKDRAEDKGKPRLRRELGRVCLYPWHRSVAARLDRKTGELKKWPPADVYI